MYENEVEGPAEAAAFMANEVVNEYHAFPVVHSAALGKHCMYMQINEIWFQVSFTEVIDPNDKAHLEVLVR